MDEDSARFILNLFWKADGGCSYCAGEMIKPFIERFPQFESLADEITEKKGYDPMCWRED
jgi:hypothetical protein